VAVTWRAVVLAAAGVLPVLLVPVPGTVLVWTLAVVVPLVVLLSRLYRGMHWPTDVAASVVFALVWLLLLRAALLPAGSTEDTARRRLRR